MPACLKLDKRLYKIHRRSDKEKNVPQSRNLSGVRHLITVQLPGRVSFAPDELSRDRISNGDAENCQGLSYLRPLVAPRGADARGGIRLGDGIDVANGATFGVRSPSGIPRCHDTRPCFPPSSQPRPERSPIPRPCVMGTPRGFFFCPTQDSQCNTQ